MNTATVLLEDKEHFRNALLDLMFDDGIGPWEADDHAEVYARIIFKKASPTAIRRVRDGLFQMRREVLNRH